MTEPSQPQQSQQDGAKWTWQFTVAVVLLLAFAALVVVMLLMTNTGDETVWQRRVYLFGAVEAVVFTAVGWLFGREVHRSAAESAQQEASEAKQDVAAARDEAKQKTDQAADAERRAAEERTRAETVVAVIEHSESAGATSGAGAARDGGAAQDASAAGGGSSRPAGTVVDLKALVRDLYS